MTFVDLGTFAVAVLLLIGAFFTISSAVGLVKLDTSMKRLHAPTKVGTMGIGSLLLASIVMSFVSGGSSFHELLIMAFLFVTAPISANFISKVHIHLRSTEETPALEDTQTWSTMVQRDEVKVKTHK